VGEAPGRSAAKRQADARPPWRGRRRWRRWHDGDRRRGCGDRRRRRGAAAAAQAEAADAASRQEDDGPAPASPRRCVVASLRRFAPAVVHISHRDTDPTNMCFAPGYPVAYSPVLRRKSGSLGV